MLPHLWIQEGKRLWTGFCVVLRSYTEGSTRHTKRDFPLVPTKTGRIYLQQDYRNSDASRKRQVRPIDAYRLTSERRGQSTIQRQREFKESSYYNTSRSNPWAEDPIAGIRVQQWKLIFTGRFIFKYWNYLAFPAENKKLPQDLRYFTDAWSEQLNIIVKPLGIKSSKEVSPSVPPDNWKWTDWFSIMWKGRDMKCPYFTNVPFGTPSEGPLRSVSNKNLII